MRRRALTVFLLALVLLGGAALLAQSSAYTVRFWTAPSYLGSINFAGSTYASGSSASFPGGTYQVSANVPDGYVFLAWVTRAMVGLQRDGVRVASMRSQSTTAAVTGSDDLVAVIVWPVRLRGTVTAYNTKPFAVGVVGRIAFQVRVEEVLQDVSGRFTAGDVVEVWVKVGSGYDTAVGVGDYVEVYGYGYHVDLSWVPLSPRMGVLVEESGHYVTVLKKAPPPSPVPTTPHVGVRFATGEPAVGVGVYVNGELKGYTDSRGVLEVSVSSPSLAYSKVAVYAAGLVLNYEGSCQLSPGGSCTITLMPREGCIVPLTKPTLNVTAVEGEAARVNLSWVFAKCSPNSQVIVAAYDANGSMVDVAWDGGDAGYTHTVITRSISLPRPGTYVVKAAYTVPSPAPGEGILWVVTVKWVPREGYRLSFRTEPPGVGYVRLGNESFRSGDSSVFRRGPHNLSAVAPEGFLFYAWRVKGNATLLNPSAANTTVVVGGDAEVTAVFAWPVRLRGRVSRVEVGANGSVALGLAVEEVLLDPSGLAKRGDAARAVVNWSLARVEGYGGAGDVKSGDLVELAGIGFWAEGPPGYTVVVGAGGLVKRVVEARAVNLSLGLLEPPVLAPSPLGLVPLGQASPAGVGSFFVPAGSPVVLRVKVEVNASVPLQGACGSLRLTVGDRVLEPLECEASQGALLAHFNVTVGVGNYTLRALLEAGGNEYASSNAVFLVGYAAAARGGRVFSLARDTYRFAAWPQGEGDARAYLEAAFGGCPSNSTVFRALLGYLLAGPDYSLGVASTLSALFAGKLEAPRSAYALSRADVERLVVEHQFRVLLESLAGGQAAQPGSLFEEARKRVDAGEPPVLVVQGRGLLVVGYYEGPWGRYLVAYDGGKLNTTVVLRLYGDAVEVPGLGAVRGAFLAGPPGDWEPCSLLSRAAVGLLRGSLLLGFSGVGAVEVRGFESSAAGPTGALLLPADGNYTVKLVASGGAAAVVVASVAGERLVVANYSVRAPSGSVLYLTLSKAAVGSPLGVDVDGDGKPDEVVRPLVELYDTRGFPAPRTELQVSSWPVELLAAVALAAALAFASKLAVALRARRLSGKTRTKSS